jgi:predicted nucleic acid-binding protein
MIRIGPTGVGEIDTSVLIGLLDPQDVWHEPAMVLKQALQSQDADVAVFDCVLAEALSTMAHRVHEQRRTANLDRLVTRILADYPEEDVLWVLPDVPALYPEIVELIRFSGGELNFNDALIALSCSHRGIPLLASFDRDFDRLEWLQRVARPADLG